MSNTSSNIDLAFLTVDNLDLQKTQERIYKKIHHHFLVGPLSLNSCNYTFHIQCKLTCLYNQHAYIFSHKWCCICGLLWELNALCKYKWLDINVPQIIDRDLLFIVGYGLGNLDRCPPQPICGGFDGDRIMAFVNNI